MKFRTQKGSTLLHKNWSKNNYEEKNAWPSKILILRLFNIKFYSMQMFGVEIEI